MRHPNAAVVYGDIVLDSHLYGGVKMSAISPANPGTRMINHLGGAELTRKLLKAASHARAAAWDDRESAWQRETDTIKRKNAARAAKRDPANGADPLPLPSRPQGHPAVRPSTSTHAGLVTSDLKRRLPPHLHSFGVWTPHPAGEPAKPDVWRVQKHFGYGPAPDPQTARSFSYTLAPSPENPGLIVIDDGGIHFRHQAAQATWPSLGSAATEESFFLLKMSAPLCRGDLWPALAGACAERLMVVVAAEDLRGEDALIRRRLSWEQAVTDTLRALRGNPLLSTLLRAAHVVVTFRSAGALWLCRAAEEEEHATHLIYDPSRLEGDFQAGIKGSVYGYQTCVASAIGFNWLARSRKDDDKGTTAIAQGIVAGLAGRRALLRLGHGVVTTKEVPGLPVQEIGSLLGATHSGFSFLEVPPDAVSDGACRWTISESDQNAQGAAIAAPPSALISLALLTARHGRAALGTVPNFARGKVFTIDRAEIESLRTLDRLIRTYEDRKVQERPLSLGVFGPPGAGKSFGVKALARAILGDTVPILEFNLSQFDSPDQLIGPFHRIRDAVLRGTIPVVFWDEFDSQEYRWLQYLLAPMQDGAFHDAQIVHPVGKCVFIFAGGTADCLEEFGPPPPEPLADDRLDLLPEWHHTARRGAEEAWQRFRLHKGPDFISRLHGHLNVLGPNPRTGGTCPDLTWPIRRALMLRTVLGYEDQAEGGPELEIDPGLLHALLSVPHYTHGSRSFEKILLALAADCDRSGHRLHRSSLPPDPLLARETDLGEFHRIITEYTAMQSRIEAFAAAMHQRYLDEARANHWPIRPEVDLPFDQLSPEYQAANRSAARRVPDHLALINFQIVPAEPHDDNSWQEHLKAAIEKHLDRLARAEHQGWNAERFATGWAYAKERDDTLKLHPSLVDWDQLSPTDKGKDRTNIRVIPDIMTLAGCKAISA